MSTPHSTSEAQHVEPDAVAGPTMDPDNPARRRSTHRHKPTIRDDERMPLTAGITLGMSNHRPTQSRENTSEPFTSANAVATEATTTGPNGSDPTATFIATTAPLPTVAEEDISPNTNGLDIPAVEGETDADAVGQNPRDNVVDPAVQGEFHICTSYNVTHRIPDGSDNIPLVPDAFEMLLEIRARYPHNVPEYMQPGPPPASLGVETPPPVDQAVVDEQPASQTTTADATTSGDTTARNAELGDFMMDEGSDGLGEMDMSWTTGVSFNNVNGEPAPKAVPSSVGQTQTANGEFNCLDRRSPPLIAVQMSSAHPMLVAEGQATASSMRQWDIGTLRWSWPLRKH